MAERGCGKLLDADEAAFVLYMAPDAEHFRRAIHCSGCYRGLTSGGNTPDCMVGSVTKPTKCGAEADGANFEIATLDYQDDPIPPRSALITEMIGFSSDPPSPKPPLW